MTGRRQRAVTSRRSFLWFRNGHEQLSGAVMGVCGFACWSRCSSGRWAIAGRIHMPAPRTIAWAIARLGVKVQFVGVKRTAYLSQHLRVCVSSRCCWTAGTYCRKAHGGPTPRTTRAEHDALIAAAQRRTSRRGRDDDVAADGARSARSSTATSRSNIGEGGFGVVYMASSASGAAKWR